MLGLLMPHAPVILPEVGGDDAQRVAVTYAAMEKLAEQAFAYKPDVVVVISPHGPVFADAFAMWGGKELAGDLSQFLADEVSIQAKLDEQLRAQILLGAVQADVNAVEVDDFIEEEYDLVREMDYAALLPLYFLRKAGVQAQLLHISTSGLSRFDHYRMGQVVGKAVMDLGRRAVIIASGDCSHRLTEDAPSGYHRDGAFFDISLREWVQDAQVEEILFAPDELVTNVAEDVLRPLSLLFGCFDSYHLEANVISYDRPFGVGYMTAAFSGVLGDSRFPAVLAHRAARAQECRQAEHPYTALARAALERFVLEDRTVEPPADLPGGGEAKAVFVSIKKDEELRGCIGSLHPSESSLGREIIRYAIEAGTNDPRFFPVEPEELPFLTYSVDVLGEPEAISTLEDLDPETYGVIVTRGDASGVLLPNLAGIEDAATQVAIAKEKAGIPQTAEVSLHRFLVERFNQQP